MVIIILLLTISMIIIIMIIIIIIIMIILIIIIMMINSICLWWPGEAGCAPTRVGSKESKRAQMIVFGDWPQAFLSRKISRRPKPRGKAKKTKRLVRIFSKWTLE